MYIKLINHLFYYIKFYLILNLYQIIYLKNYYLREINYILYFINLIYLFNHSTPFV